MHAMPTFTNTFSALATMGEMMRAQRMVDAEIAAAAWEHACDDLDETIDRLLALEAMLDAEDA